VCGTTIIAVRQPMEADGWVVAVRAIDCSAVARGATGPSAVGARWRYPPNSDHIGLCIYDNDGFGEWLLSSRYKVIGHDAWKFWRAGYALLAIVKMRSEKR
jgi:hypothetical protein